MMTTVSFNNTETRLTIEDIITFIDNMQKSEQSDKERNESEQSKETDKLAHMFSKEILDIISEYKENIKVCDPITYIDEMNVSLFSSVLACITNNFSVGKLNHNDLVKEFINIISHIVHDNISENLKINSKKSPLDESVILPILCDYFSINIYIFNKYKVILYIKDKTVNENRKCVVLYDDKKIYNYIMYNGATLLNQQCDFIMHLIENKDIIQLYDNRDISFTTPEEIDEKYKKYVDYLNKRIHRKSGRQDKYKEIFTETGIDYDMSKVQLKELDDIDAYDFAKKQRNAKRQIAKKINE